MNIDFHCFDDVHRLGENATGAIAHFSGFLALLILLAGWSMRRRLA
jgi:MYXO-CTERM domain-containing protein